MIDTKAIFRYKIQDGEKLLNAGFELTGKTYRKSFPIMQGLFRVDVAIVDNMDVEYGVYEDGSDDEYVLVHVENAASGFVDDVRMACKGVLIDIAERCFDTQAEQAEQSDRMRSYIKKKYGTEPEFLWERYPDCAAFRKNPGNKWFAVVMTVEKGKIGLSDSGSVEIIDLKDTPESIVRRLAEKNFFKAYHMNKKHWYTVCLDGSVPDEELMGLIERSFNCVK